MNTIRNKKGETLVEVIVSITIFTMLFASIAALINTSKKMIIDPMDTRQTFNDMVNTYNVKGVDGAQTVVHASQLKLEFSLTTGLSSTPVVLDLTPNVKVSKTYQLLVEMRDPVQPE